ncbi:MAG: Glyoxalase/bleomycin resistance protein/dioxygenase [Bacteroidetes bacterium]|nr:Glyoxalase/bleomycin resistance protein/dioxygenase [Bacteroidota bacterium]
MAAPVTHFEIMARDAQRAKEFYAKLFGWSYNDMPEMAYGMVDTGVKMGINGGVGQVQENQAPCVTFYVQVEDLQAHLDKAVNLGGTVIVPVTDVAGVVTFAQFKDPDGNMVGLVKGPQEPPKPVRAKRVTAKKATAKKKVARRKPASRKKGRK